MRPVGPYRNIKHVALFSQADTKLIFQSSNHFQLSGSLLQNFFYLFKVLLTCLSKKLILIAFHPISGLFSIPSLFTYFIKICIDGHGRQSKSPKSKKFYPQASTKIISSCQVHSYKFLHLFKVITNKMKRYSSCLYWSTSLCNLRKKNAHHLLILACSNASLYAFFDSLKHGLFTNGWETVRVKGSKKGFGRF